jgi:hypothetical protein
MKMICDMHAEAMDAVGTIQNWLNDALNTEFENLTASTLTEWIDLISQQAWLIEKAVTEATQAGQRMEDGLWRKRNRIEDLETINSDLESTESDQASKIADLESDIRQLENTVAYLEKRLGNYE